MKVPLYIMINNEASEYLNIEANKSKKKLLYGDSNGIDEAKGSSRFNDAAS